MAKLFIVLVLSLVGYSAYADQGGGNNKFTFTAHLSSAQETIPTESDASGRIVARFARDLSRVHIRMTLSGINSMVVAAHLHCALAGANGPAAFGLMSPGPLIEINDKVQVTLTNDDAVGSDCVPAAGRPVNNVASLYFAMREGLIYLNVHTLDAPPGELRGQLIGR